MLGCWVSRGSVVKEGPISAVLQPLRGDPAAAAAAAASGRRDRMAGADGDDSLYPIAVLIDELRNEDVQVTDRGSLAHTPNPTGLRVRPGPG